MDVSLMIILFYVLEENDIIIISPIRLWSQGPGNCQTFNIFLRIQIDNQFPVGQISEIVITFINPLQKRTK